MLQVSGQSCGHTARIVLTSPAMNEPSAERFWLPSPLGEEGLGGKGVKSLQPSAPSPPTPLPRGERGAASARPSSDHLGEYITPPPCAFPAPAATAPRRP